MEKKNKFYHKYHLPSPWYNFIHVSHQYQAIFNHIKLFELSFLDAELLYDSLCLSVGLSVCRGAFSFFERIIAKPIDIFEFNFVETI